MGRVGIAFFVVFWVFLNYSYALTPEQIIKLKQTGVEDNTIRMMIRQEMEAKERDSATDSIGMREIKDGEGNTVIVYSSGKPGGCEPCDPEQEKVDKAWRMLQNMIIDNRK